MKKNEISLLSYLFFQFFVMILIAVLYFMIIPYFKQRCYDSNPCASATHCTCNGDDCECEFMDYDGQVKKINCVFHK